VLALLALLPAPAVVAGTAATGTGGVTLERSRDPGTHAPGIQIVYTWDHRFGAKYDALVRLYQGHRLVGRITFLAGWTDAPAFFRTASSPHRHAFRAVGKLLHSDGSVVRGSGERAGPKRWAVIVEPGQVT
jgi:hypothetical protein